MHFTPCFFISVLAEELISAIVLVPSRGQLISYGLKVSMLKILISANKCSPKPNPDRPRLECGR